MKRSIAILLVLLLLLSGCASTDSGKNNSGENNSQTSKESTTANNPLVPKPMAVNAVNPNPYMATSENSVHNDSYSSDVSNAVLPLGIDSSLSVSIETQNPQAPSAAFYDEYGDAITPFNGGIAIGDMSGEYITRQGVFVPSVHDTTAYRVQVSYSFVDSDNNVVLPTTHGHVIILKTRDQDGNVLSVFEKVLDVDVATPAQKALGTDIDTRLLSIIYDYEGNLWFVTGGFRIIPDQNPAGFIGYLSREYIDKVLAGEEANPEDYLHYYRLEEGESAENGISSSEHGAVILTNMACYTLKANDGVEVLWRTPYESNGTNDAQEDSDYTGGGLAYGGGSTPTLTKDLVLFTDNLDPVNLLALDATTGELVASIPVLDGLGEDVPVSVENSIIVYSGSSERTSIIVCNWFGAGNAGLSDPDADSAVQSYDNLYDQNWMAEGGKYIAPGVERVDVVKTEDGYKAEKVWFRDDIRDTAMMKLSTATGYVYGYWQNLETGYWCYEILDFDTGNTLYELPVSTDPAYNNVAVGMINDVKGNGLYCPTNAMEMLCMQDNFVSLVDTPAKTISPRDMERYYITEDQFKELSGKELTPASYLMKASVKNLSGTSVLAFRLNGLSEKVSDYTLYYEKADGTLTEYELPWSLCDEEGTLLTEDTQLKAEDVVQVYINIGDGEIIDSDSSERNVKVGIILTTK